METWIKALIAHPNFFVTLEDVTQLVHLVSIAIAFGTVVSADVLSLKRFGHDVSEEFCQAVENAHSIIIPSLAVAWFTGVGLLVMRTGLDIMAFTPKLWAKIAVVTSLTATAYVVKFRVLPAMRGNLGRTIMEVDRSDMVAMALCAGFSMAGWLSAFMLAGLAAAKTAPGWLVLASVVIIHIAILSISLRSAVALNTRVRTAVDAVTRRQFG